MRCWDEFGPNTPKKQRKNRDGAMKKGTIEKFGLQAIADAVKRSSVPSARVGLSQLVGAAVDVSGTIQKVVKRDGKCKLVIEPGDVRGFVVFADCRADEKTVISRKIRKVSFVSVRGKLASFGASAVCLADCRKMKSKCI